MYAIEYSEHAVKQMAKLPKNIKDNIIGKIKKLAISPQNAANVKVLYGEENLYRLRVGDYRVVYKSENSKLVILVLKVQHRKDVYK